MIQLIQHLILRIESEEGGFEGFGLRDVGIADVETEYYHHDYRSVKYEIRVLMLNFDEDVEKESKDNDAQNTVEHGVGGASRCGSRFLEKVFDRLLRDLVCARIFYLRFPEN